MSARWDPDPPVNGVATGMFWAVITLIAFLMLILLARVFILWTLKVAL